MRLQLSTTIAENRAAEKAHAPQTESLRLCPPPPPPSPPTPPPDPGARTGPLFHSPHPCSSQSQPGATGDPQREAYPTPHASARSQPKCQVQGAVCRPAPRRGPDPGPPPRSPRGGGYRTRLPPAAASPLGQTKPHASAAAARCAPTRPGPAREEGARPGGGNARDPPPRGRARRRRGHSLDEVAGALLREALLPAAGQVCGDARKVQVKLGRPGARPPGRPIPPAPRPPERIMWPELTGSPVRGCSQVVRRSRSLRGEVHLLARCPPGAARPAPRPPAPRPRVPAPHLMKKTRPSRHTP